MVLAPTTHDAVILAVAALDDMSSTEAAAMRQALVRALADPAAADTARALAPTVRRDLMALTSVDAWVDPSVDVTPDEMDAVFSLIAARERQVSLIDRAIEALTIG